MRDPKIVLKHLASFKENQTVTGNFAISHSKFLKLFKYLLKLIGE